MSQRQNLRPNDRVRVPDEGIEGIVISIGLGLGDNNDGTEIVRVNVAESGKAPDVRSYFATACEVISRGETDRVSGGEDGGTLKAGSSSDATSLGDDAMSDEELERLTEPDGEDAKPL